MSDKKRLFRNIVQGIASLFILWYIITGDPTRYPPEDLLVVKKGMLASSPVFLALMMLLFFIEGLKAADRARTETPHPVKSALEYYIPYWKLCIPLTAIGYALFSAEHTKPFYSPMYTNPSFANISRGLLALTNNIHEGTWLVSCAAICAFFSTLYAQCRARGNRYAPLLPAAGVAASAVLYMVVMPFHYHKAIFPIAAVLGTASYMAAFVLYARLEPLEERLFALRPVDAVGRLLEGRAARVVLAPLRYIGRRWVDFWMLSFIVAFYYYEVAASVYRSLNSIWLCYVVFLLIILFLLFAIDWLYQQAARAWRASKWSVVSIVMILALPFALHFALEASTDYGVYAKNIHRQWPFYGLMSWLAILCVLAVVRALVGRWHTAGIVTCVLFAVLGIANHFTMEYHGTLLTVEDLKNIETAANVAGGYDFSPDAVVWRVVLLCLAGVAASVLAWLAFRKARPAFPKGKRRWIGRALSLVAAVSVFYLIYLAEDPLINKSNNVWNWVILYSKIGYFNGTVESTRANFAFTVRKPASYSEKRVNHLEKRALASEPVTAPQDLPDIIIILNETYYNLDAYMDTGADVDYMRNYNALDNAIKGYVEVPLNGGGTNATEYETLTGNSAALINAYSPYNRLDFTDQIALPTYLKRFGYSSFAAHPLYAQNYLRGLRWRQLEFDEIHFLEDFTDLEYYGKRRGEFERCTDISAMKNMFRFAEELPEDGPRLGFLITIQNHGGWNSNPPELALVHSSPNTQDEALISQIDEFLSCMALTDESISFLQQYYTGLYEKTGRRVIVCMFGDHSPKMLSSLAEAGLCKWEDEETIERIQKTTPYFIWANYPLDMNSLSLEGTDDMDLCCLMPTVLDVAGVPLSYYYQHTVDMRKDVAVFTNVGAGYQSKESDTVFCDRSGAVRNVGEGGELAQLVIDYYNMEYNLCSDEVERKEALFWPAVDAPE